MNNQRQEIDLGFTKEHFPEGIHMCLIYDREEDRQKIVSEYMAAGFKQGEQVCYFTDVSTHTPNGSAGGPNKFWMTLKELRPDKAPVSINDFIAA